MAGFEAVLDVTPRPSPSLRLIGGLAHLLAGVAVAPLVLAAPVWGIAPAALLCSAWHFDRGVRGRGRGACQRFRWSVDHRFQWQERGRGLREGRCVAAHSWGALWVRLVVRPVDGHLCRHIVLPRDAVDAQTHRRLRVRCRVAPPARLNRSEMT